MRLPSHKTKIVCTIGPACRDLKVLESVAEAGMGVARLNFSHDTIEEHGRDISRIRQVAKKLNRSIPILIDLPGPKIRIGELERQPLTLNKGETIFLSTRAESKGDGEKTIPVNYERLPKSVSRGSTIYLDDGFIQLKVISILPGHIKCRVVMGGALLSRKGLNIPHARLFLDPVTEADLSIIEFGLEQDVNYFCASFVTRSDDIIRIKEFARRQGKSARVIAKIERAEAVKNIAEILEVSDAIMIARGDLGMEIPIEHVPATQKRLIFRANLRSRPVITATQMLESMTENVRPTRAEVTDVANAILDGTDAVMLSGETAVGKNPIDSVKMMSRIAKTIEAQRKGLQFTSGLRESLKTAVSSHRLTVEDVISLNVIEAIRVLKVKHILAPTHTGSTPRRISRFKPDCWILAFCEDEATRDFLELSYGVHAFVTGADHAYQEFTKIIKDLALAKKGDRVVITEMVPPGHLGGMDSLGIVTIT